jgi:hypothetical protein
MKPGALQLRGRVRTRAGVVAVDARAATGGTVGIAAGQGPKAHTEFMAAVPLDLRGRRLPRNRARYDEVTAMLEARGSC